MFIKKSYIKRKLRGLSLKIFNTIENNGNCNFDTNGKMDNFNYSNYVAISNKV